MGRVCVINILGLGPRLLELDRHLGIQQLDFPPHPLEATLPALAPSVQASMTTGADPGVHGVIGGCVYRRQQRDVSFCERSNTLLACKRFWHRKSVPKDLNVAMVYWSNPLAGAAQQVIGCYAYAPCEHTLAGQPLSLYGELLEVLGPADRAELSGPGASWRASRWLAQAAREIWQRRKSDLMWVNLPGLDFDLVRFGLDVRALAALRELDTLVGMLLEAVRADGGQALVVSDGAYVPVSRVARPNHLLRRAGLLSLHCSQDGQTVDLKASRAFVLADHQVGQLYSQDDQAADEAAAVVAEDPAVAGVAASDEVFCAGAGRERAGQRVVLAAPDAYIGYQWWGPDEDPPALASREGLAGKCGYDPCDLLPGGQEGGINPDPLVVRASRGLVHADPMDQGVLAATCRLPLDAPMRATDLPDLICRLMFE